MKSTLRPGFLVSLKTQLTGNVEYVKKSIEDEHEVGGGTTIARWETERTIALKAEHEESVKVRTKARGLILAVCSRSSFGLLARSDREQELRDAVAQAQRIADEFNDRAETTEIVINVLYAELLNDELEATKAINGEVRELIAMMEGGIKNLDVNRVRDAANRAKSLGAMLSDEANDKLKVAINAARKVARAIVKKGDIVVGEIDQQTMQALADARTAFLDTDATPEFVEAVQADDVVDIDTEDEELVNGYDDSDIDIDRD